MVYGKPETNVATIKMDATKKPAHIDLKMDDGPNKGKTLLGIITIDGETIKLCVNEPDDKKRPTEFKTSKDDRYVFLTLKKTKK